MMTKRAACQFFVTLALTGCTGISVAPTCPNELQQGESATVTGNVLNPGAIPEYQWTVDPPDLGSFNPPDAPITTFTAEKAGDATLQLTASDGLYQVQSECFTHITPAPLVVTLRASPTNPITGDAVVLICESAAAATIDIFTITQTSGPTVILADLQPGRVRFTANVRGDYGFQCVGSTAEGQVSEPAAVTVSVTQSRGGR